MNNLKVTVEYDSKPYGKTKIVYTTKSDIDSCFWELSINGSVEMNSDIAIVYEAAFNNLFDLIDFSDSNNSTKEILIIGGGDLQLLNCISSKSDKVEKIRNINILDPLCYDLPQILEFGPNRANFNNNFKNKVIYNSYTYNDFYPELCHSFDKFDLIIVDVSDPECVMDISYPVYSKNFLESMKVILSESSNVIIYRGDMDGDYAITDKMIDDVGYEIIKTYYSGYGYMSLLTLKK